MTKKPETRSDQALRFYAEGLSRLQIAERMNITVGHVRAILSTDRPVSNGDPEACRKHWHDLIAAYPGGMPVVGARLVKTITAGLAAVALLVGVAVRDRANAHDIYTGLRGKAGNLCCGGSDCAATTYRETKGDFEFFTREQHWVKIPVDLIIFLPIPGDPPSDNSHLAHLCYRSVLPYDKPEEIFSGDGQDIHVYCAFIPPGAI